MGKLGKIQLTPEQVLEFVILGIKNGKYEDAIAIAQDCLDQLREHNKKLEVVDDKKEETNERESEKM